jgi:hypothetical protein
MLVNPLPQNKRVITSWHISSITQQMTENQKHSLTLQFRLSEEIFLHRIKNSVTATINEEGFNYHLNSFDISFPTAYHLGSPTKPVIEALQRDLRHGILTREIKSLMW